MDEWIHISERHPEKYQEVIICSDEDKVKGAIYMGDNKWNTYTRVEWWQPLPKAPKRKAPIESGEEPKKRGRKKK